MGEAMISERDPQTDRVIWIERLSPHGEVLSRHRIERLPIVIGRGYESDLLIDDPTLAARHLRIGRNDSGELVAEDLGSRNGLCLANRQRVERCVIELGADAVYSIGDTRLRLRGSTHAVPEERPIGSSGLASAWIAPLLGLLIAAQIMLSLWLQQTGEPAISKYLTVTVMALIMGVVWALVWSLVNRLFAGAMQFSRHLALTYAAAVVSSLITLTLETAAYSLSWPSVTRYRYLVFWLTAGLLCAGHLRLIGGDYRRFKLAVVAALTLLGVGASALSQRDARERTGPAVVVDELLPPAMRLAPAQTLDAFIADAEKLRAELDAARQETPHDEDGDDDF
ncbi:MULTISPECIES: FHA domain-containing protein [Hydrocarboniphaga]|jgi:hypothetical protein|uniref:FHA domain-containing protein n=2 Tax=Hydrocarboniphaga effusa TaxID=243629 RepID=I8T1Q3_9GAMM|nr:MULTISPECIES: FHA domain-containing protein [Hydrocarboniphaga]EIT67588.1 hypothetical protein WQQ_40230 [Hydrocarboniphaga effusa AP103]MDZ4080173.1 FHA domain-containing protein [Hydrocarboniphaga sp.]